MVSFSSSNEALTHCLISPKPSKGAHTKKTVQFVISFAGPVNAVLHYHEISGKNQSTIFFYTIHTICG